MGKTGYTLFGTLIDNKNTIAFTRALHHSTGGAPENLGSFLKRNIKDLETYGTWKAFSEDSLMMGVASFIIKEFKEKSLVKITEVTIPDDFTTVDWVYVVHDENKIKSSIIKVHVYNHGKLVYDGLMKEMPITTEGLEPSGPCRVCGELTNLVCSDCEDYLCEDCGYSTAPPYSMIEDHTCEDCWNDQQDMLSQEHYGD